MDVLSEVLRVVRLQGALFFHGEFSAPFHINSPCSDAYKPFLPAGAGHVIVYHLVAEGKATARLLDGERMDLQAGDLVIFPHGDNHILEYGAPTKSVDMAVELGNILSRGFRLSKFGGGGDITRFICGYMGCDPQLSQVFLSGLPRMFKVSIRNDASGRWLENSIRFSANVADQGRAGGDAVLAKLSEVLFVETLRFYISQLPKQQTGWLAGVRDPEVGKALAWMHRDPARPWTIADLAREAGVSRSVLAERFRHYLDEPPMSYLTKWRLQLSAQRLSTCNLSVAQIASEVGYESEAAFSRAFKREFGKPPARFRNASREARTAGKKAAAPELAFAV